MEALGGRGNITPLILDLGTRWGEWSGSRPGRALPTAKGSPVPIGQEAGWAPEPVWTRRLEEKSFAPRRGSFGLCQFRSAARFLPTCPEVKVLQVHCKCVYECLLHYVFGCLSRCEVPFMNKE
jgi:hypothetical protein